MVKDKKLKNLNNKGEMNQIQFSRSVRMRNFNKDIAASNFATNM